MARFYKYFIFFFSLTILSAHPTFTTYSISTSANTAYSVYAVDGDGEMNVLSASYQNDKIAWYENDGYI